MNAKTDFKPLPETEAIAANSKTGQKMLSLTIAFGALAQLSSVQHLVSAFAFFVAKQSVDTGMPDDTLEQALVEFAHMARMNRASLQSQLAGAKS